MDIVKHGLVVGYIVVLGMRLGRTFEGKVTRIIVLVQENSKKLLQDP